MLVFGAEPKIDGVRETYCTSGWRVTAQKPGPSGSSCQKIGRLASQQVEDLVGRAVG